MEKIKGQKASKKSAKKGKALSRSFYTKVYYVLGITLIFFALLGVLQTRSIESAFDEKLAEAREEARPGIVELLTITTKSCGDCYDINPVVSVIESTGVNVTSKRTIDQSSAEAQSLVQKYGIEKLPTVIVTGEIDKTRALALKFNDIGEEIQDAYVFTKLEPPFVQTSTGKVRGRVTLIQLTKECENCAGLGSFIDQLTTAGLKIEKQRQVDVDSEEGIALVAMYEIEKVPTLILDKEAEVYANIQQSWIQIGSVENNGAHVLRELTPPYFSIPEDRVIGLVTITFLTDKTCTECYDPARFHTPILQRMGLNYVIEEVLDIADAEGASLVELYNIEKVPTFVLTGDVDAYPVLVNALKPVGSVETDGAYVFRKVELSRPYKDLEANEIVTGTT